MKTIFFRSMCALIVCGFFIPVHADEPTVVFARVWDRPPVSWTRNGQWVGMDIEFYQALEKASGLAFKYVNLPWTRAIQGIKTGDVTIMTQLSRTAEREGFLHFLGPYNSEEMVVMTAPKHTGEPIASLDDLVGAAGRLGLQIGIVSDVFYGKEFNARLEGDPVFKSHFYYFKTIGPPMALMLKRDRLFGLIDQRITAVHRIRTQPDFRDLVIHPFVVNKDAIYFGISKQTPPRVVARLKAACDNLIQKGVFAEIEAKWKTP